jgi:hypothetical protein
VLVESCVIIFKFEFECMGGLVSILEDDM